MGKNNIKLLKKLIIKLLQFIKKHINNEKRNKIQGFI